MEHWNKSNIPMPIERLKLPSHLLSPCRVRREPYGFISCDMVPEQMITKQRLKFKHRSTKKKTLL